ncbi:SDR family NAD(P)-dependent oxidoreductase [Hydrogenophaga sp. BPS33]|uniref:SDR family NAD(P)-dependent oxidoreductase n=1 Tax=Hydrogenophaga sp. BPS33 TaxID=2651974 RepID=UPI00131F4C5E|nr:SDR family NAD(P)-dependent oxidoreductase [Hydrogenophaga sp. BPS33]QHE87486.1 SDR family oxidoreductase [Hydrogenophaga sp. BPS33]
MNLSEEVILITGAAQGLGEAMAIACARAGAAVVVADINEEGARKVVADIQRGGGRALALSLDVANADSVNASVAAASEEFGFVSVLVNNAMFARYGPIEEIEAEVVDRMLAVGLKGILLMCQAVVPGMRRRKHGVILNLSSVVSLAGVAYSSAYAALKGGTDALTRALASELGSDGIRVNSIAPSAIPSEMSRRTMDASGWEERRRRTPMAVIGTPENVSDAVMFLASSQGKFISGVTLPVDGGFSMAALIPGVDLATVQRSRR